MLPLELRPRFVRRTMAVATAAAAVMLAGTWVFSWFYRSLPGTWSEAHPVKHVLVHLNLGAENVLAAWFSSMLLLTAAGAAVIAFTVDAAASASRRMLHVGWLIIAMLFTALSFDELGSIHERVSTMTWSSNGELAIGWYALLILLAAIVSFMAAFGLAHVRRVSPAFLLMALGIICFASIPFQERIEIHAYRAAGDEWLRPVGWLLLEEGTELAGSIFFLGSALAHAAARLANWEAPEQLRVLRLPSRYVVTSTCAVVALLGAGLVASQLLLGTAVGEHEHGIPRNWFPAMLAFIAASGSLWFGVTQGLKGYRAAAPVQFVASAFVGAGLYGWQFLAMPSVAVRGVFAGAVALLVGTSAVLLFRDARHASGRLGVAAWGVMLFLGMVTTRSDAVAPLILAASSVLLFVTLVQGSVEGRTRQAAQQTGYYSGEDHRNRRRVLQEHD